MNFAYMGKAAVLDFSTGNIETLPIPDSLKEDFIGGRGFIGKWLIEMLPDNTDALSEDNILIFAAGALTGTLAPTGGRSSVGSIVPETGVWSIGSVGGVFGSQLKRAGWDALIIKGRSDKKVYIKIVDDCISILPADDLWGMDTRQTMATIRSKNQNHKLSVASIGPAGENQILISTIIIDGVRSVGRGGLGAVMGSKNLKAIAVAGSHDIPISNPEGFYDRCLDISKRSVKEYFNDYWNQGSYAHLHRYNVQGSLSTRNGQQAVFENLKGIIGDTYVEKYKLPQTHACFACTMPCWHYHYIKEGKYAGLYDEDVQATTFKEFGARCGLGEMDGILAANSFCGRMGMDTISAPAIIAFAMECFQKNVIDKEDCGGMELNWGDDVAILTLLEQMAFNKGFGAQLSKGIKRCAEAWGGDTASYALHVKGLETVATDPRGQPSWGLVYATSNRGACHMRAFATFEYSKNLNENHLMQMGGTTKIGSLKGFEGKGKAVAFVENLRAIGDSVGMCHFLTCDDLGFAEVLAPLYEDATGIEMPPEKLFRAGERIYNLERIFNINRGLTPKDDSLPARYTHEPIPEGPSKGQVCNLEPMLKEYYAARDWDPVSGYPSSDKLVELSLAHLKKEDVL